MDRQRCLSLLSMTKVSYEVRSPHAGNELVPTLKNTANRRAPMLPVPNLPLQVLRHRQASEGVGRESTGTGHRRAQFQALPGDGGAWSPEGPRNFDEAPVHIRRGVRKLPGSDMRHVAAHTGAVAGKGTVAGHSCTQ